ncbi:hypothetical protein [Myxococcus sp. RHSTA-1-4]|uniref:hypothetical protein n=1 Tax=Myxococcus sp. RHSTA-1-4 TaxID=2874601 RepID=UPI001CBE5D22|nr:hypothetical protein [Myxococcus sp. RHSTA-1-4]MBZ4418929.1 hypothetical protein [Myxococcus sp. RHSTA-1-4]
MQAVWHARALVLTLLLIPVEALTEPPREGPPWYVPDHASLQLAGSIGLLSAGPGWAFLDEAVEAGLLLGWAPPLVAGEDFLTLTLKGQWHPFRVEWRGWSLRPLTVGMLFSYTFGDAYFVRLPDRYPDGYYWFKTGLRPALLVGGGAGRPVPALGLRLLEGYFELVATDYRTIHFVQDPGTVRTGLFSLALGARFRF